MKRLISSLFGQWRSPRTPHLTSDQLALGDSELAWAAFDAAGASLDAAGGKYLSKVRRLPPQWRFVYTLLYLDGQVNNGGFHQFFVNSQGLFDSHLEEDAARLRNGEHRNAIFEALKTYRQLDYREQWANIGKSWDRFASAYKDGRFSKEDSRYYAVQTDLSQNIGQQIRSGFSDYSGKGARSAP